MSATNGSTRVLFGLPAVLQNDYWIVFSSEFTNLARIPVARADLPETFKELSDGGFFVAGKSEPKTKVVQMTFVLTNDCNLRCRYCFADSGIGEKGKAKTMSEEIALAVLRRGVEISNGRKLSIAFFGGEPTMQFKLIQKIVAAARQISKERSLPSPEFSITTNGMFGQKVCDYLMENEFLITLSADGPADVQDFHRPTVRGSSSPFVERTIGRFAKNGYRIKVRATVTQFSVHRMADTVRWLSGFGNTSSEIHFEPVSISGRARFPSQEVGKPTVDDFILNLKKAIETGNEVGVSVMNSSFMNLANSPSRFCEGDTKHRFAITPDGAITTCVEVQDSCHPASDLFVLGNYDTLNKSFVIQDDNRTSCSGGAQVVRFRSGKGIDCFSCFASRICGGGCPVRNFHTAGKTDIVDPYRCTVIREVVPYVYRQIDNASE